MQDKTFHIKSKIPPYEFELTKTNKLSQNGLAIELNEQQIFNLRQCEKDGDMEKAFNLAKKYWHKS